MNMLWEDLIIILNYSCLSITGGQRKQFDLETQGAVLTEKSYN